MSKQLFVLLETSVVANGQDVPAGEVIALPELSATALVNEGKGVFAEPAEHIDLDEEPHNEPGEDAGEAQTGETGQDGTNTQDDLKTAPGDAEGQITTSDDREATYKTIYAKYTDAELRPLAKEHGIDFAYDATKKDLVYAIIDQGKAAEFLQ
jgi:hypothetical protein